MGYQMYLRISVYLFKDVFQVNDAFNYDSME